MQEQPTSLASHVAEFVAKLKYEDLPAEIVYDVKYRLLDWLGCALAAVKTKPSCLAAGLVMKNGGINQSTVITQKVKVPVAQAAWANGITGHIVEYDDGHRKAIAHPGAVTVPTSLALAEYYKRTGQELLTAIVAGYEVLIRLGIAVNPSHYKIWHTTSTCGTFAAAASASSLLKLDQRKTQMALGIAGTMAAGLQETFGTFAKPLNIGHACQSGIQAAMLAGDNFTGPEDILLGKKGFMAATSSDREIMLLEQLGDKHFLANTAFYKMYSSCGHTHSPLDAVLALIKEYNLSAQRVKSVKIETYRTSVELTGRLKHSGEEEAKFSLPYCIACALLYHKVTLAEFTTDKLRDPELIDLAAKVRVVEDAEATKAFPKRLATVTIELNNGQSLQKKVSAADDTPQYDTLEQKFMSLATMNLAASTAEQIKETVLKIDQLDNISALMGYLN